MLAVAFEFLAARGFTSGNVLVRVGPQKVPAPTAAVFTVLIGMVLVAGLALILNSDDMQSLTVEAIGWVILMGITAYPRARLMLVTGISMAEASGAVSMSGFQPVIAFTLGVILLGERPNLLVTLGTSIIVAGLFLVIMSRMGSRSLVDVFKVKRLGYVLALCGAAAFASRDVISRHAVSELSYPLVSAGLALVVGSVIFTLESSRQVIRSIQTGPPISCRYVHGLGCFKEWQWPHYFKCSAGHP